MKKILFLLILVFASTVSAQSLSEEYAAIMNDLMYMKYKQKFKHLDKVFKDNPNDPWYYWMKADIYALGEKDKETRTCYEKAISLDSTFAAGYGSYARYLVNNVDGDFEKAVELSTKAIELDRTEFYYYIDRAEAYLKLKKYDEALSDAFFYIDQDGVFVFVGQIVLINCYIEQNDQEKLAAFVPYMAGILLVLLWNANTAWPLVYLFLKAGPEGMNLGWALDYWKSVPVMTGFKAARP